MSRFWKASVIALSAILTLAPMASAQQPQRRIIVRQVYVWPAYDPFYWDYWGPGYYPHRSVYVPPTTGDVKLKTDLKEAAVYVDGGYAGKAGKLKKFPLAPGTHEIELRDSEGKILFSQHVNVILGKTTELDLRHLNG